MTVPVLITTVMGAIRTKFYADRPAREFRRDERALTQAVAKWGYACHHRGWDFTPEFILAELMRVLIDIQRRDGEIQYLPVYLSGAVTRSIGQRAEELHAAGRKLAPKIQRLVDGAEVVVVREKGNTETLAALYRDLQRHKRQQRRESKPAAKPHQRELL